MQKQIRILLSVSKSTPGTQNASHTHMFNYARQTTLRQRLIHPKDKTPKPVACMQCSEECADLCIGETKQQLYNIGEPALRVKTQQCTLE